MIYNALAGYDAVKKFKNESYDAANTADAT